MLLRRVFFSLVVALIAALASFNALAAENVSNFSAVITKVTGTTFEVLTNPNADPQSAYKKENKTINVDVNTTFEASAKEDLKPGRNVQVVGRVLENGEIQATKVIVYDGNTPVRMRSDALIRRADGSPR
jgi:hypothetical protein